MADKEQPDDTPQGPSPAAIAWGTGVVITILSPLTTLSAFFAYALNNWQRVKLSVIFTFIFLPITILSIVASIWTIPPFINYLQHISEIISQQEWMKIVYTFLLEGTLGGISIGILLGMAYAAIKNRKRPEWENIDYRLTPIEFFRRSKNIKDIQLDRNSPKNGMTLGVGERGERVVQSFEESSAHTLVLGASGSGKTTTMKSRLRDALKTGQGAIVIDLKGDPKFAEEIYDLSIRYNHKFRHWLMQPQTDTYRGPSPEGPAYYDPISRGDATRRTALIIDSRPWSEEHYKIQSTNYLQIVMNVLVGNPKTNISTLAQVVELLDPHALQERAVPLGSNPIYHDVVRAVDALNDAKISQQNKQTIESLQGQLRVLLGSVAGTWLQIDPKGDNNIDIKRAAHEGEVIFFSLDSSNYGNYASLVANLIIQDLKTVSSELRTDPTKMPFQVIIDEFQAIGSDNVIGLINKSRDAKLPVTLATQALGDLRQVSDSFLDSLVGIVGSFIIHRPNKAEDAQIFAGLTGTTKRFRVVQGYGQSQGMSGYTGQGSIQEVEEPIVSAGEIQKLSLGEMIYVNKYKSPQRIERVQCIPEDTQQLHLQSLQQGMANNVSGIAPTPSIIHNNAQPDNAVQLPSTLPPVYAPQSPTGLPQRSEMPVTQAPDLDKLSQIFTQDPNMLLNGGNNTQKGNSQPQPSLAPQQLPVVPPVLKPTQPVPPVQSTQPIPALPRPMPLPPLPSKLPPLPVRPVAPAPNEPIQNTGKDEFDF